MPASKASTSPLRDLGKDSAVRAAKGLFADATPVKDDVSKKCAGKTEIRHSLKAVDQFMPTIFH